MQTNTGNQGNQTNAGDMQKFVPRTEMAIMQYVILSKAQQEVTKESLKGVFKGNLQMSSDHFDHCIKQLVSDGHLKENNGKYVATDDGREDVQKLQHLFLEIPNVVGQGGQTQKQGMTQQQGVGGKGSPSGGNVGGNQQQTSGANTGNKGGATNPTGR